MKRPGGICCQILAEVIFERSLSITLSVFMMQSLKLLMLLLPIPILKALMSMSPQT